MRLLFQKGSKGKQLSEPQIGKIERKVLAGLAKGFAVSGMGLLWYKDRTWNPMDTGIDWEILEESHASLLFSSFRHHGNVTRYESS